MTDTASSDDPLSPDERAALRAYLQRSEVRLSTVHRVASALLSGAGLMVLFPALERDAVTSVLGALLTGDVRVVRILLVVAVVVAVALPLVMLWLVLRDLTQFYFHANHLAVGDGSSFAPRFTLTGLRLPNDELGPAAAASLAGARADRRAIELLVPANSTARARIDSQLAAHGGVGLPEVPTDHARAAALFELAASRPLDLFEEVAKVEHGMVRHVLRIQVIVLRYVKAVLAMVTTAIVAFALAGVVEHSDDLTNGDLLWLACIMLAWVPFVIHAATTPVRWLDRHLRSEGATGVAVAEDRELTRVEEVTVRVALVGFVAAGAALIGVLAEGGTTGREQFAAAAVGVLAVAAVGAVMHTWTGGGRWRRLLRRDLAATVAHLRRASQPGRWRS